jgi:hypothetical protein
MKNVTLHFPRRCRTDNRRYHNTRSSGGSCTVDLRASRIAGIVHPPLPCHIFILLINKLLIVRNRILPQKSILPQIISILCNMKFHHHVPNSLWISPILRQRDPNRNLPPYPFKNVFSIILSSTPRLSKWPTPFRCSHKTPMYFSTLVSATRPAHFSVLDSMIIIIISQTYKFSSSTLCTRLRLPQPSWLPRQYFPQHPVL